MIGSLPLAEVGITPIVKTPANEYKKIEGDGISNILEGIVPDNTPAPESAPAPEAAPELTPAPEATPSPQPGPDEFETQWGEQEKVIFSEPLSKQQTTTPVVSGAEIDYKKKASEYEAILNDPHVKAIVDARKAGKDIFALINELKGVDTAKLSGEDLIAEDCKRLGITDQEAISAEIDNYNSLTPRQQAQERLRITTMIEKEQNERLSQFSTSAQQSSKEFENQANKLETELTSIYNTRLDKEYFGIKATPEILQSTRQEIDSVLGIFNQDGTYNAKNLFDLAYLKANISSIMRETGKNMYHKGLGKAMAEVSRPDKKETSGKPMTVVSGKSPQENSDEFVRMFGGGGKN